ncbi:hypothetical protein N0V94_003509 [Neodidymelliopsis sp. IMI 364377]|nr:hypothetical protein N0V94_003509 [Neodidymelliopsis sp. IMI 364377]
MDTVEATVGDGPLEAHLLAADSGPGPWYDQTHKVYEHVSAFNIHPSSDDEGEASKTKSPWSDDPAPGPLPNTYDQRHGHIDMISVPIEPYHQQVTSEFPEIPNRGLGSATLGPEGKKKKSAGVVDWTCGMTALANIDRSMPNKIWFFLEDDQLILRSKRAKTELVEEAEESVEEREEAAEGDYHTKRMKMEHAVDPGKVMDESGADDDEGSDLTEN